MLQLIFTVHLFPLECGQNPVLHGGEGRLKSHFTPELSVKSGVSVGILQACQGQSQVTEPQHLHLLIVIWQAEFGHGGVISFIVEVAEGLLRLLAQLALSQEEGGQVVVRHGFVQVSLHLKYIQKTSPIKKKSIQTNTNKRVMADKKVSLRARHALIRSVPFL